LAAGDGVAGRLLTDEALSTRVDDTVTALRAAAARADTIAVSVDRFAEHLNRPGALPNDLVTDQRIYPSLVAAGDELEQAARAASGAVARVEAGLADDGSPLGVLVADPAAGADLKSVLVRLDTSAQLLTEDLEAAQHNFLLRGYFRKQERAAARAARDAAPPREPTQ
jgi:phospholipid/cholesterol/gamma-HCH transport system substrate-binding protein